VHQRVSAQVFDSLFVPCDDVAVPGWKSQNRRHGTLKIPGCYP
jgi:hypothetical protein